MGFWGMRSCRESAKGIAGFRNDVGWSRILGDKGVVRMVCGDLEIIWGIEEGLDILGEFTPADRRNGICGGWVSEH